MNTIPNDIAVNFENVSYAIGKRSILDQITLAIKKNSITGILGPNGAGKSTLLSLVIGLHKTRNGTITVLGEKLPIKGEGLRKRIGVVLQETALYNELTVFENLRFAAALYDVKNEKERITEVIKLLGLQERANEFVKILSGGLRRRATIARALIHQPELLVIDEPTLGVDAETRHAIWEHLRFLKSTGTTILVATNYLDEAQAICDTVAVLQTGTLITTKTPEQLIMQTGSCLDIDCDVQAKETIIKLLADSTIIKRIEPTASGISLFLEGNALPDDLLRTVLQTTAITGFRVRPPDLAEVFHTLKKQ